MSSSANRTPTVAHFRRIWFKATETFLYTTVANQRRTRPLLIGYERDHADDFPVSCPVVTLYPPRSPAAAWRQLRRRLLGPDAEPHFDTRRTWRRSADTASPWSRSPTTEPSMATTDAA